MANQDDLRWRRGLDGIAKNAASSNDAGKASEDLNLNRNLVDVAIDSAGCLVMIVPSDPGQAYEEDLPVPTLS